MLKSDFFYDLPPHLIAQTPLPQRSSSRLLSLQGETGQLSDLSFKDLPSLLNPEDLLVFNNTRVIPARLYGQKDSGGKVQILIERILDNGYALVHIKSSKPPKLDCKLIFDKGYFCFVMGRKGNLYIIRFIKTNIYKVLAEIGRIPLPPYIRREFDATDLERYQSIFAKRLGAIAAPTASLHFDAELLDQLKKIGKVYLTLHVGSGTFQPLRVENLNEHVMHAEPCEIDSATVERILACKARGGRVIAVGTTVVRTLETAALSGKLMPYRGDTQIFIHPGFQFKCVDAMITNFHLPESTLLTLVCAFAGYDETMKAYSHAIEQSYRFFSYGDAMFLTKKNPV